MIISKSSLHYWMLGFSLLPLVSLFFDLIFVNLGSNPIESLHIRLGDWSLRFLLITLAITPIQTISRWRGMSDFRQLFGLMAAFYATLHVFVYLVVDHALDGELIWSDIIESRFIWLGMLAYLILFFLALTSSKPAKKFMGKNWKKLHRLIYIGSAASLFHYFWQLKGNLAEPLFYLILLGLLLGFRVVDSSRRKSVVVKS